MADYSKFDPGLASWLQKVWQARVSIKRDVMMCVIDEDGPLDPVARKQGVNKVYDIYNPSNKKSVENEVFKNFIKRLKALQDHYSIECTPTGRSANDWFHFLLEPRQRALWRIYLRFKEPLTGWESVASYCLQNMVSTKSIVEFKVAGPGLSKERGDHMVIMLKDQKSMESTLEFLKRMSKDFEGHVPPGVKEVLPGLGYSAQPLASEDDSPAIVEVCMAESFGIGSLSFGDYLAGVIYMALEQSWDKSEDDYVKELFEFFLNLRIDPKHPHLLRSISETEFQMLVKNAQGKILSHGLAPQSAGAPVMINKVNPYPCSLTGGY